MYSCKISCLQEILLYSGKVVVYGENWLYSCKRGYIRAKFVCIRAEVVVLGQKVLVKWLFSGKSCCIQKKLFIRAKVDVIRQGCCYPAKEVVIGQKWLYSCKVLYSVKLVVFGQKLLYSG